MSHFSLAVFTKTRKQSIEKLLAPYDEGIKVAPYVRQTKAQIIQEAKADLQQTFDGPYSEWQKDPKKYEAECTNPGHIKFLKKIPGYMKWTDEDIYQDAVKDCKDRLTENGDLLSIYNPKSKWDWYEIGGRWSDFLLPKAKKNGDKPKRCNIALVSDLDFEAMRKHELDELTPYEKAMTNSLCKEEYMRKRYPTEEEYIKRSTAFHTYAVVTPDGIWHETGKMGWFGMTHASPEEEREWELNYCERFIKPAIDNNWTVTIVDCHI
jgi:hypothetical protein